jgi:hypothetical protein
MSSIKCRKCERKFDFDERDFQPLSSKDKTQASLEKLDLGKTVKLVCPFCDTSMIIEINKSVSASPIKTASMAGRNYTICDNLRDMGESVRENQRSVYTTTFGRIPEDIMEINQIAGRVVEYKTDLMVKCDYCQSSLNKRGIEILILSHLTNGNVRGLGQLGLVLLDGKCPGCGNMNCFLLYDPAGFDAVRS